MNFNTSEFLFVFLPLVIVVFHVAPRIARLPVLLASSFFFYWVSGDLAFTLLVVTVVWSALMAFLVARYNSLWIIIGAVAAPLGFLFIFKYLGFALDVVGAGAGTRGHFGFILQHVLPAGISFYTFQVVSYLIDIRDGTVAPEKNPIKFATFISFFPQLIAGPILRFEQISGQLDRIAGEPRLTPDLRSGVKFLTWGLAYKILFADVLRSFHELHDLTAGGGLDALYSVLAYSLIIYFDFWSYSLMAIGLGKFFCIDLPRNFHEPYMSTSPREFWRRWHVTLSFWLRDYVYLRLGGNRAYILNIVVVFVACGIWHGAGWNFIVWGAYHGALVILYHLTAAFWDNRPKALRIIVTFALVSLGWPLFYLDLSGFTTTMGAILTMAPAAKAVQFGAFAWGYLGVVALWTFAVREDRWLFNTEAHRIADNPIVLGLMFAISAVLLYFGRTFIYFNF
ncbi:MAG: MBOAT family protein [Rhodospirillaceae bacterium]|jgi:alginate O-acetyltransferase complex protein AlgI|nr:MBOAT family protein [Rhodospirillaceae bacterium]MBT5514501.1 MBOAT family protein [Rhodospirillaceae bacterium]MBT6084596.1 MBOAT family protein [Rhodospirillaceae bacterium]MBT6607071.1 MBOAT family protein [Rhodospirillaceae bacterium]MBT6884598.1 MBOAT family protein [Rhodospirillaceae bacterium]